MQRFASLAFGMTYLQDFYYNICYPSSNLYPVSFNSDWTPNAVYGYVAQANQEIKCLSPSLSRLVSTGVTMLPGKHVASFLGIEYTANNSLPSGRLPERRHPPRFHLWRRFQGRERYPDYLLETAHGRQ
jgi:hypothetical protein